MPQLSFRDLVDDLLDLSRLEGGSTPLEEVAFSLPSLVGATVRAFLPPAREKGLELLCEIDPDTPDGVRGDPARLRQVLTLLLDNALKFTEGGRVTVAVRPAGGRRRPDASRSPSPTPASASLAKTASGSSSPSPRPMPPRRDGRAARVWASPWWRDS